MNIFEICKEIVFENFISVYIEKMIIYTPILPLLPQHVPLFTLSPLFLFLLLLLSSSLFCHVVSPISATHTCMIWNPSLKYGKATMGTQSMKMILPSPSAISSQGLLRKGWGLANTFVIYVRTSVGLILCRSCAGNYNSYDFISTIAMLCSEDGNSQNSNLWLLCLLFLLFLLT